MKIELTCLLIYLQHYPIVWRGFLSLKNDQACVQMHFVHGSKNIALDSLPIMENGQPQPSLKIAQRMRLEPSQLEGVTRKIKVFLLDKLDLVNFFTKPVLFWFAGWCWALCAAGTAVRRGRARHFAAEQQPLHRLPQLPDAKISRRNRQYPEQTKPSINCKFILFLCCIFGCTVCKFNF